MRVRWRRAWRIIASRYPPIDLFERAVHGDGRVADALIALEELTNPRVRDEIGEIALVPPDRRVSGPGASYVMAAFTHINRRGSRFADGTFGAYYAAATLDTAIAETAHHFAANARDSADPPRSEDMRVLVGTLDAELKEVAAQPEPLRSSLLDPDDYSASQRWARDLRAAGTDGIHYPSVRRPGGECIAVFWPDVVGIPLQERHLQYHWDGERIDRYFDYSEDRWIAWP